LRVVENLGVRFFSLFCSLFVFGLSVFLRSDYFNFWFLFSYLFFFNLLWVFIYYSFVFLHFFELGFFFIFCLDGFFVMVRNLCFCFLVLMKFEIFVDFYNLLLCIRVRMVILLRGLRL
jgi:hypothetical protein